MLKLSKQKVKGRRFTKNLKVIGEAFIIKGKPLVVCQCKCGRFTIANLYVLKSGQKRSCGCGHLRRIELFPFTVNRKIVTVYMRGWNLKLDNDVYDKIKHLTCNRYGDGGVAITIDGQDVMLGRYIINAPYGMEVDHKDGNQANNTRENLRLATRQQNTWNTRARNKKSGCKYKGVRPNPHKKDWWQAIIRFNNQNCILGSFSNQEEAARMYDKHARKLHGEFARLNFPRRGEQSALQ